MKQCVGKAGLGLQRMAEGVAKVQQGAGAGGLALVLRHDARLGLHALCHRIFQRFGIARSDFRAVLLAPGEELRVAQNAVLDHFRITGTHLAPGQGIQRCRVGEHQCGLVKRADKVLARARVDRRLATDAAVHLRQQGGGDLHETAAALQHGGSKAGKVTHHAAA